MKRRPNWFSFVLSLLVLSLLAFWQRAVLMPAAPVATGAVAAETGLPPPASPPLANPAQPGAPVMLGTPAATLPVTEPVFARFADWTSRYLAASPSDRAGLLAEGRILAAERRAVLAPLIRTDPRAALAAAVPMVARQQLPTEIVDLLEERVAGPGDLVHLGTTPVPGQPAPEATYRLAVINDTTLRAHVFGRREISGSVAKTSINGIALDGHLAVAESPLRVLEPGEIAGSRPLDAVCRVSGTETPTDANTPLNLAAGAATAVEYDGAVHVLCGANHLAATEGRLLAREESNFAAAGPGSSDVAGRPAATWTHGAKRLLIIRVDFSDRPGTPINYTGQALTDDAVFTTTESVKTFYANNSFGQTSLVLAAPSNGDSPDVSPVLRMPQPSTYYDSTYGSERSWQLNLDARAAAQAAGIAVSTYDRVGVVFSNLNYWWSGLGEIGGANFWINAYYELRIVSHELGHTYGLMHANSWAFSDNNPISPSGTSTEYGDVYDVMGGGGATTSDFSQWNKSIAQWIPDSAVTTVTTSGLYRIYRFDHPQADLSQPLALKVRRNEQQDYWIGYRGGTGNPNADNGAYILWGYHNNQQGNLLDMTPQTPGRYDDAPLPIGVAFTDPGAAVTIKTIGRGGSGAGAWLDVQVSMLPSVRWSQTGEYNVGEQDGTIALRVLREGDATGAIAVNYATVDGTATAPGDFAAQTGVLSWAAGDTADKIISIPVQSDSLWEAGERFTVNLSNPTGAIVQGNAAATVAILDAGIRDFGWTSDWVVHRVYDLLMQPDGSMIIGGAFQQIYDERGVGNTRQSFAKFSAEGRLDPAYAAAGGVSGGESEVRALASQPDGRVIVGGSFEFMQGASHANLARVLADGNVDPTFSAGTNGKVWVVVALPDGRLLIGGAFTSVNGVPREYVARLNADGTLDTTWVGPDFDGAQGGWVRALALQTDGNLLVGGKFTLAAEGYPRSGFLRLLPNGTIDPVLAIQQGAGGAAEVRTIVVQADGKVLVGGDFSGFNGDFRGSLARLNADGRLDPTFVPRVDGRCDALLPLPDGRLAVGGWFFNAGGTAVRNLALFQASGAVDANAASAGGGSGEIFDLQVVPNGRIQFAGDEQNFEFSQQARSVWRMISGITNPPGTVQLRAAAAHAPEGGSVTFAVSRTGGSGGAISLGYATAPGTAADTDFQRAAGVLTWADGDAADKSITILLNADSGAEPAEAFTLGLGAPVLGGAALGGGLQAMITIDDGGTLPPSTDWQAGDIGAVGAAGSSSESGGVITLTGAGADIWGQADAAHFRSQSLTGDGAIIVRVASMGNTHPWSKVGLMFREDLSPGAREVMAYVTPGNHSGIQYRLTPGVDSAAGPDVWSGLPVWLMLSRAGNTFGAYRSYDGNQWTQIGTVNCSLPATAYVGLAISSHVSGTTATATLDNLELIGVEPPSSQPPVAPSRLSASGATASTVQLTWTDNSTDETGFAIERALGTAGTYSQVATVAANSRAFTDTGLTANTTYVYRIRAFREAVYSSYSDTSLVTTSNQPPTGWQALDIGNVGPGGWEVIADPNITVKAGGADIWFAADGFRYVYQAWHGDGEIKARVASLTNTHPWAKAGVMFRETLSAGSRNVAYVLTADNTSGLQARVATGGDTTMINGPWVNAPYWIRLVRSGDTFTASTSPDGVTWTTQGSQTVPMGVDLYVGVAASAHTTTQMTTAAFEYVTLPGSQPPPPPPPPPSDWTQTNFGAGSGSFTTPDATSVTVNATGADIWGQFDDGVFVRRAWSGNGEIVAKLESLTNSQPWAKAGLMFRSTIANTSPNIFVGLTPTNGVTFQMRSIGGGVTSELRHDWLPGPPSWLKLTRVDDLFTAAYSFDGVNWTSLGTQPLGLSTDTLVGFAVSSHASTPTTAVFTHISMPTSPPPPPPPPPPADWTLTTLGTATGSFLNPDSTHLSVTSTGDDFWGQADSGTFVQRAWTGDGAMTVRVDSFTNTHPWAKVGVMIRESLAADAANLFAALTASNGATFQVRGTAGGSTTEAQHDWLPGTPCWLRLTRAGNLFTAAYSFDGFAWTTLGSQTLVLPATIHLGFAVSSHTTASGTAAFSNFQIQ